jgi:hypothetical protein
MRKSGVFHAGASVFVAGLLIAVASSAKRPGGNYTESAASHQTEALTEYEPLLDPLEPLSKPEQKPEVVDLSVKELPAQREVRVQGGLTDGFRPGSIDPTMAAAAAVARTEQWSLGELIVENSEVTDSGFVEYSLRGTLRGDIGRSVAAEVVAAARAVSPEVSIVSDSLHFTTRRGDELDSLSRDAIRVRVRGGLTFEPSMLRWTFLATPAPAPQPSEDRSSEAGIEAQSGFQEPIPALPPDPFRLLD